MRSYDVLIVGAGPAGASLAWLLSDQGMKVGLLEKESTPVRKICGEYLCPQGVELLKDWGFASFVDESLKIRGMRIFSPNLQELKCEFPRLQGISIRRDQFDEMLRKKARLSGANLLLGVRLKSCERTEDGWRADTTGGKLISKILVGADGVRSIVAKTTGLRSSCKNSRLAVHCFLNNLDERVEYGEMHLYEQGSYLGVNPTGENELNLGYVVDAKKLAKFESPRDFILSSLRQDPALQRRLDLSSLREIKVTPSIHRNAIDVVGENLALVGDAAGFLDPLTGEGLYGALLGSSLLANQLKHVDLNNSSNVMKALHEYEDQLRASKWEKNLINSGFQRLIKHESLLNWIGDRLSIRPNYRTALVGVIGNVIRPHEALHYCLS